MASGEWNDGQFAGMPSVVVAAHELKAPLALMRQISLLVCDEVDSLSAEDIRNYQQQILATVEQAIGLSTDLANITQLNQTLFPLEPVNPFAVCQQLARRSALISKVYDRQIDWPNSRKNTLIVANRTLLERIVMNFINNAVKYTETDSVVKVLVKQRADFVRVSVRDYGPAMSRREYRRLLDEMETIKTIRTRPDSSGLGIYLASEFAKAMQGKIGLTRHRTGVSFFVDLPISGQMRLL